jgi:uncharacterized protein (TIGR01777 family)
MRVAISGASGYIGTAVRAALEAGGHEAVALRRGPESDPDASWSPAEGWVREGAFDGIDAVVHVTGASIGAKRWSAGRRELLRESRIDATRVLVDHIASLPSPPSVFVAASAIGIYGERGDEQLTDDAERGSGFIADLVADWEAETLRLGEHGVRAVALRFGPLVARDSELMARLLMPFRMGVGGRLGSGKQWFSWVSAEDAVAAVLFALAHDDLSGPLNVTAPQPLTNADFTRALGRALGRPTVFPMPALVLRAIFGVGRAEELLLVSQRVLPARLIDAGFEFQHATIESAFEAHLG